MIIGIGNDLVDIRRIEKVMNRFGVRFQERCFSPTEQSLARRRQEIGTHIEVYAKRFAAKEACAKALGTGISQGVYMRDISVEHEKNGRPYLVLTGGAQEILKSLIPHGKKPIVHLSMTDDPPYAQAYVVIEAREE